jgi:NAD+ kinase
VLELSQQKDIQLFFDELDKEEIVPVVYQSFLNQLEGNIRLPANTQSFSVSNDLTSDIEFFVSLGGDGTLLDTVTLVRNKNIPVAGYRNAG